MTQDDDISQAFREVSVADFERETSALDRIVYEPEHERFTSGRNNFNGFVDSQIDRSKEQANAHGFHAFSTLHNATEQRHYHPDEDETASQYAERLAREARNMQATWFFNAMFAPGRAYQDGEEPPDIDVDDPDAIREALESGQLHLSICWFAQCNEEVEPFRRSGIIVLDEEGHTTPTEVEGDIDPESNPFHYVMGDSC